MVKDAPPFEDIAGVLYSHLEGTVMVAHNARFDHGFLKAEYKRIGGTLRQRTLCTVKLSRKLYPHAEGHSLDAIMKRFGLTTSARHRGMGDVQLMLDFLEAVKHELGSVNLDNGKPKCEFAQFGLVPIWATDKKKFGLRTYNARSETAHEKPTFRNAWKERHKLTAPAF